MLACGQQVSEKTSTKKTIKYQNPCEAPTSSLPPRPDPIGASFNQSLQATPTNASDSSLKLWAGLCHRCGVPELYRSLQYEI